ncbi:MAG TPA: Verru_Chthon cassette protein D [Candidatus Methylacidiphilales bacterium]
MKRSRSFSRAFSLIELLVVVAVMGCLAALAAGAFASISRSAGLNAGGNLLLDQLNLARQTAIAKNCQVEFRIYQLPPADAPADAGPSIYRAFQSFAISSDGTRTNAVSRVGYLPRGIQIARKESLSSLLQPKDPPFASEGTAAGVRVGNYPPASYTYVAFHFRPDGGTDLGTGVAQAWYLSLAGEKDLAREGEESLPANFVTVQLDPKTGRVRSFRPN